MKKLILIGICLLPLPIGLNGCIPVGEAIIANHDDGMHQTQLNQDTYIISYKGHSWNTPEEENRMLLKQAATITKQKGYNYFIVLNGSERETVNQYTTPGQATYTNYGYGTTEQINGGQTYSHYRPTTSLTFKIIEKVGKNVSNLMDADIILNNK